MTVYDEITFWMRRSFAKNGSCLRYEDENEYILYELNRMNRREFLEKISEAIETRLDGIQNQIDALRERLD